MHSRKTIHLTAIIFLFSVACFANGNNKINVYNKIIDILLKEKNYFDASEILMLQSKENADTADTINRRNRIQYKMGEYYKAITDYETAKNGKDRIKREKDLDEDFPEWRSLYSGKTRKLNFQDKMNGIRKLLHNQKTDLALSAYNEFLRFDSTIEYRYLYDEYKNSSIFSLAPLNIQITRQLVLIIENTAKDSTEMQLIKTDMEKWKKSFGVLPNEEMDNFYFAISDLISRIEDLQGNIKQICERINEQIEQWKQEAPKALINMTKIYTLVSEDFWKKELKNQLERFHEYNLNVEYLSYCLQILNGEEYNDKQQEGILSALHSIEADIQKTAYGYGKKFLKKAQENVKASDYLQATADLKTAGSSYDLALMVSKNTRISEEFKNIRAVVENDIKKGIEEENGRIEIEKRKNEAADIRNEAEQYFQEAQDKLKNALFESARSAMQKSLELFERSFKKFTDNEVFQRITDTNDLRKMIDAAKKYAGGYLAAYNSSKNYFHLKQYYAAMYDVKIARDNFDAYSKICSKAGDYAVNDKKITDLKEKISFKIDEADQAKENAQYVRGYKDDCRNALVEADQYFAEGSFINARTKTNDAQQAYEECSKLRNNTLVAEILAWEPIAGELDELNNRIKALNKKLKDEAERVKKVAKNEYISAVKLKKDGKYDLALRIIYNTFILFDQLKKINPQTDIEKERADFDKLKVEIETASVTFIEKNDCESYYQTALQNYKDRKYPMARSALNNAKNVCGERLAEEIKALDKDISNAEYKLAIKKAEELINNRDYKTAEKNLAALKVVPQIDPDLGRHRDVLLDSLQKFIALGSRLFIDESDPANSDVINFINELKNKYNSNSSIPKLAEISSTLSEIEKWFCRFPYYCNLHKWKFKWLKEKNKFISNSYNKEYRRIYDNAKKASDAFNPLQKKNWDNLENAYLVLLCLCEFDNKAELKTLRYRIERQLINNPRL